MTRFRWLCVLVPALVACPKAPTTKVDDGTSCNGGCTADERCDATTNTCVLSVAPKCGGGSSWSAGEKAFEDVSAAWGLTGEFAAGVRISSGDLDGDGWADVAIRKAGNTPDDPAGARTVWLLHNDHDHFTDV